MIKPQGCCQHCFKTNGPIGGFRMLELGNAASAWKSLAEALRLEPRLGDDITAFAKRLATEGR